MSINYNGTIKSLRDIVWGVVTDPLSQIEQITLLIFIKLLSEKHNELERLKAKKLIFTGDFASYHFDSLSRLSGYELVDTTRKAVESLYKNPNIDEPIRRLYERSYLQVNDPRVLSLLINEINKIDITHIDMGDFYEHLLSVLGTQKEAGQFRTPRHLIKFIVDIVDPQIGERVLDPACGTAGFLTAAYTHIRDYNSSQEAIKTNSYLDKLNFDQKTFLLNKTIFGFDIDPKMIKFAISNLYLHNIKNPNISQHNTLTSNDSWEEKYDVILTNPPFSTPKGGVKPTDRYTLDSKRTEVLFLEYVIEHLTLNGRAGVIVPEGIIFQSGKAYKELRKWLVENNYLYAVVSLPSGVFNPYSGVKTSILFLDRERAQKSDKILFCKVDNDGFDLGAQRRPIDKNDLPEVLKVIKEYKTKSDKPIDSPLAYLVSKQKIIQSGDYNLTGDRYKETASIANQKWSMVKLGDVSRFIRGITFSDKDHISNNDDFILIATTKAAQSDGIHFENLVKVRPSTVKKEDTLLRQGDILISVANSANLLGRKTFVKKLPDGQKYSFGAFMGLLRPNKEKILPELLDAFLSTTEYKAFCLSRANTTTNISNLNWSDLSEFSFPLPPLSVQQQIVDEINGYQKIIDGAKQVVDNYKPQIKTDPKWEVVKFGQLVKFVSGITLPITQNLYKDGVPIITIADVDKEGIIHTENIRKIKLPKNKKVNYLVEGDLLFNWRNGSSELVGKTGYFNLPGKYVFASFLLGIRTLRDKLNPKFSWYLLNLYRKEGKYLKLMRRNINGLFNRNELDIITISLPPLKIQSDIIAQIEEEQKLIEANKKLIQLFEQKIKDKIEEVWGK